MRNKIHKVCGFILLTAFFVVMLPLTIIGGALMLMSDWANVFFGIIILLSVVSTVWVFTFQKNLTSSEIELY